MEKNKNRNKVYILLYVILKEKKVCNDEKEKEMRNLPTMIKYQLSHTTIIYPFVQHCDLSVLNTDKQLRKQVDQIIMREFHFREWKKNTFIMDHKTRRQAPIGVAIDGDTRVFILKPIKLLGKQVIVGLVHLDALGKACIVKFDRTQIQIVKKKRRGDVKY